VTGNANTTVAWSVAEGIAGGTSTFSGRYTAPGATGTYKVVATSQADPAAWAAAIVTVSPAASVAVTVRPATVSLAAGGAQQFTSTVTGSSNTNVTWSVLENSGCGVVSPAGHYTAPGAAATCHVVATSQADATKSASATVTVSDPAGNLPTLVQHLASDSNIIGRALTANNFRFTLPNPVRAGNALILGISYGYASGRLATVTDGNGNTWPAPAVTATDGGNTLTASVFVLPNARAGITTITVSFNSAISNQEFQYTISEFHSIATSSPVSGTSANTSTTAPGISSGTFTPGNNDGNGGNLVWTYCADSAGGGSRPATNIAAGSGFNLLDANIGWPAGAPPFPHASEYSVQAISASITPGMTVTQAGGNDRFDCVSVALRAASAGTAPSGMRIVHLLHQSNQIPSAGAWHVQFPSSGNLIVGTVQEPDLVPISSITDTRSNRWVAAATAGDAQIWFVNDAASDPNLKLTVNITGSPQGITLLLYDIAGADPSAYDGAVHNSAGAPAGTITVGTNLGAVAITPVSLGLTIARTSFGTGPSSGFAPGSPSGAIFDYVYYTGETDLDTMDNADFAAHVFNTDLSTETWNIALSNGGQSTTVVSAAAHFKSAAP
jgi:hypothetical protein